VSSPLAIPETLDEVLSPAWLSEALATRFPGIEVSTATLGPVVERVSTNARFRIECVGGLPEGLPAELCAKGYYSPDGANLRMAGIAEALFYRDLVDGAGVRTLPSVFAAVNDDATNAIVITEDVASSGAVFLDSLTPYSRAQATESLRQFATLHARSWRAPALAELAWLEPRLAHTLRARGLKEINGNFDGPIGAGVPDAARDGERLLAALSALPGITQANPSWCLLHGDAHVGNVFLDAAGDPSLVDWQLVQRGPWYIDVGYHLGCTLPVEERRAAEAELLDSYLDELVAQGVDRPSEEEVRLGICCGLVYGFFLWAITLKVDPSITTAMLERLGAAVADHRALDVVLEAAS
jgi:hypothetical protein